MPLGLEIQASEISTAVITVNYLKFIEALIGAIGEELFKLERHQIVTIDKCYYGVARKLKISN